MEVLIPVWPEAGMGELASNELHSLQGVDVAFVDDNLDVAYTTEVEKELSERYGAIVKRLIKPLGTAPSPKSLIDEAATCRVAVVGIAL